MHSTRNKERSLACIVGALGGLVMAIGLAMIVTSGVSARYTPPQTTTHVEIDGVDFGAFDHINDLRDLTVAKPQGDESYTRVSLKRDFVTDPSLYYWAKKTSETRSGLTDIRLVMRGTDGQEVSRYTLKLCKPLSWSLESSGPATGGFYEKVDFAVQEIAIY